MWNTYEKKNVTRSTIVSHLCTAPNGTAEVPGFTILQDALSEAEEAALLAAIDAAPWETSIKRRVQHCA